MMRRSVSAVGFVTMGNLLAKPLRQRRWTATTPPSQPPAAAAADAKPAAESTDAPKPGASTSGGSADSTANAEAGTSGDLQQAPGGADGSSDVEAAIETQRWVQSEPDHRIVDENGEYIVSKSKWHTGELAYQTPAPPNHLQARFGYNVVQVKKSQTFWQYYRWNPHVSLRHLNIMVLYAVGLIFLGSFLITEMQHMQYEAMKPGQMAGDVRGKGLPNGKNMKITTSLGEQDEFMQKLQQGYLNADEMSYMGNKEYQMKKIPRPKELRVQDYLRG